jgi:very-short-patch-repair endonuclease
LVSANLLRLRRISIEDAMGIRNTTPEIEAVARRMRASLTPSERRLWAHLKGGRLGGARFRAQHALGQVVLDFVCCRRKLVVEVDGPYHCEQAVRDRCRDQYLTSVGYRVLRFTNDEVDSDVSAVLAKIRESLHLASAGSPRSLRSGAPTNPDVRDCRIRLVHQQFRYAR